MDKKLIVLAASLDQPRIVKRIIEKANHYDSVEVYGFKRRIYNVDNYDKLKTFRNIEITIIGTFSDGKYINRLFLYLKLYITLFAKYGLSEKKIYSFGIDLNFIAQLLINREIYYEISDIIWLYKKGLVKKILQRIDFLLCKKSKRVIFTSEGFYSIHYSFLKTSKVKIIENKFKTFNIVRPLEEIKLDKIYIAYIGAFRYPSIISNLLDYVSLNSEIELRFYGEGDSELMKVIKKYAKENNNIFYSGYFKNPDDLEHIYAENNLNFVAYDNTLENERVALPNKFYESGFFNIPILCSENTFVGEKVLKFDMGWVVNPTKEGISEFFNNLTISEIENFHEKIKRIDKNQFSID